MSSLFDEFVEGVGNAITDIREKVVEEPYFGRVVTGGDSPPLAEAPEPAAASQAPSSAWETQLQQVPDAPEQGRDMPAPDLGHDM